MRFLENKWSAVGYACSAQALRSLNAGVGYSISEYAKIYSILRDYDVKTKLLCHLKTGGFLCVSHTDPQEL
jgi:hypothetical protein